MKNYNSDMTGGKRATGGERKSGTLLLAAVLGPVRTGAG